jgi:uncharacterized protein YggE
MAAGAAILIAAAFATNMLWRSDTTHANGDSKPLRTITVNGEGKAYGRPDQADISTGVTTQAPTAREALARNTAQMSAVIDGLKKAGVEAKDIQTSNFSVTPVYSQPAPGQTAPPRIAAYQVSNNVTVIVRDLAKLGPILDQAVQLGSNAIGGIGFSIHDPKELTMQARDLAVEDAKARALRYAKAAGVSVGRVLTISEGAIALPGPVYRARAMLAMDGGSVPVESGSQELTASVSIVYEIE